MELLRQAEFLGFSSVVRFQPHGRAFKVYDKNRFVKEVLPRFFHFQSDYPSFLRQVTQYDFRRLTSNGPDQDAYYHELFLRGRPDLCPLIPRHKDGSRNTVRMAYIGSTEPKFYEMVPLPTFRVEMTTSLSPTVQPMKCDDATAAESVSQLREVSMFRTDHLRNILPPQLTPLLPIAAPTLLVEAGRRGNETLQPFSHLPVRIEAENFAIETAHGGPDDGRGRLDAEIAKFMSPALHKNANCFLRTHLLDTVEARMRPLSDPPPLVDLNSRHGAAMAWTKVGASVATNVRNASLELETKNKVLDESYPKVSHVVPGSICMSRCFYPTTQRQIEGGLGVTAMGKLPLLPTSVECLPLVPPSLDAAIETMILKLEPESIADMLAHKHEWNESDSLMDAASEMASNSDGDADSFLDACNSVLSETDLDVAYSGSFDDSFALNDWLE